MSQDHNQLQKGDVQCLLSNALTGLANGGYYLSDVVFHNHEMGWLYADFEIVFAVGSNATAGATVDVYAIPTMDGTNYADGSASVVPQAALLLASGVCRADTAHRLYVPKCVLPQCDFKILLKNGSGQAFTASTTAHRVNILPYLRANQ